METLNSVDSRWVLEQIELIAQYGKREAGITRLAFSAEDRLARDHIIKLMREIGLQVRIDAAGNIIGSLQGRQAGMPVITGSHLDTVPESGKYDGVLGILSALAAVKTLQKNAVVLTHPIEIVVFAAEESSRFNYATIGGKAMSGHINLHAWSKAKDKQGVSMAQAMAESGITLEKLEQASRVGEPIKAFIELYVDQGKDLVDEEGKIGIVEASAAPTRIKMIVEGTSAHAGSTPMEDRQDALVSAAMIVLAVQEIGIENAYNGTVATVGALQAYPGVINMIPGKVELLVDIRSTDHENIVEALQDIKDSVSTIAEGQETPVSIEVLSSEKPISMDVAINQLIEDFCVKNDVVFRRLNSGAGHNAMNMTHLAPAAMILIPCRRDLDSYIGEQVEEKDICLGIKALTHTLYELAK